MFEFIFGYVKWIYVNIIDTVCDYEVFLVPAILFSIIFFVQTQPKVEYVNGEDIKMWVSSSEEVMNVIEKRWNWLSITIILFWFAGFIIIFFKAAIKDTQILKKLEILATKEEDIQTNTLKNNIRKELGIKKNIEIYRTRLIDSRCFCINKKQFKDPIARIYFELFFIIK